MNVCGAKNEKMKIGLFFGSFNPVHIGHMVIANHIVEYTEIDKIWMVVSPQSPFKKKQSLASNYDRYHLLTLAVGDNARIRPSKIEFDLPTPSYTIDTLTYLKEKHGEQDFALIMGGDNLKSFHKWKNYEQIIEHHDIYVYKRSGSEEHQFKDHPRVKIVDAPLLNISATFIRKAVKDGKSVQYLVPDEVYQYLHTSHLYK